jgi:hypothetical protein
MISKAAYEMNKSYAQAISEAINDYYDGSDYKNISEMVKAFNAVEPDAPVSESTFRTWLHHKSVPDLYYVVRLAEFMNMDIYDLIYSRKEDE